MARFRTIDIGKMLYETVRAYFSVNSQGQLSNLYKYCACLVQPLVAPLSAYYAQRIENGLIADSKYQIGQLTNVLNYLYDNIRNSIFITQAAYTQTVARNFNEPAIAFVREFDEDAILFARGFSDMLHYTGVVIHVPLGTNIAALIATVEQIKLQGLTYTIVTFIPIS